MMRSIWKANAITRFFILFVVTVLLCLFAFALLYRGSGEGLFGIVAPDCEIGQVYQSEPFSFSLEGYQITLPQGGIVAPLQYENSYRGLVFLAQGRSYRRGDVTVENITGGYLFVNEETYQQIKGAALFLPVEDWRLNSELRHTLQQLIRNPVLSTFGFERMLLPQKGGSYLYLERDGVPLTRRHFLLQSGGDARFVFYFCLFIAIVLLVIRLLTLDIKISPALTGFLQTPLSLQEKVWSLAVLIIPFLAHLLRPVSSPVANPFRGGFSPFFLCIYLVLFLLVSFLAFKGKLPRPYPRIRWRQLPRDIGTALVVALVMIVFSGLQIYPVADALLNIKRLLGDFFYCFLCAITFELFWRELLQTTMTKLWGARWGLPVSTLIFTAVFFITAYYHIPEPDALFLWELLFFLPGTALFLGYIYQKGNSIMGSSLLLTIMFFLPRVLQ